MTTLALRTPLDELYDFLSNVQSFPVSVSQLLALARKAKAPKSVIDFYETFHSEQVFQNKEDLICCSEQVDILRYQSDDAPQETERSPEED